MSRLLRKGAIIGKVALATIVAGLLLYGAASLLKAELAGETTVASLSTTPAIKNPQPVSTYRDLAESQLAAGNTEHAFDVANEMMTVVSPGPESATAAERIAKGMAAKGQWQNARKLYGYAAAYGEGDTLKLALCGMARSEAEQGGNFQAAVSAAKAVSVECRTDEKVTKALMQAGEKLARNRRQSLACQVYKATADSTPAGWEGLKAVKSLGVTSARIQDSSAATAAAERLMQPDYRAVEGWQKAVDEIASQMAERRMPDEAIAVYNKLALADSGADTKETVVCGIAAVLIMNRRSEDARPYLIQLAGPDGVINDPVICGKLGAAYIGAAEYANAIPYFQKVAEAGKDSVMGWGASGKVVECGIEIGADETVLSTLENMAAGFQNRGDKGKTFFDYACQYMAIGRNDMAEAVISRYAERLQAPDARWAKAARVALAAAAGEEPNELIRKLRYASGEAEPGDLLYEVGTAVFIRGQELLGREDEDLRVFAAADEFLKCAANDYPDSVFSASVWHRRARCAYYLRDYGATIEYATRALSADPGYKNAPDCYLMAIRAYDRIWQTIPEMHKKAGQEMLGLCATAEVECPDDQMIRSMVSTVRTICQMRGVRGGAQ